MTQQNLKATIYFHFFIRMKVYPQKQLLVQQQLLQQLTAQKMRIQTTTL